MSRRRGLPSASSYRTDAANVQAYRPADDARNESGERLRYVPLDRIHPSPYQTRIVYDPDSDRSLCEDLELQGVLQAPVVRPHPSRLGHFEVVAGHRRVRAAQTLEAEGRGQKFLQSVPGHPESRALAVAVRELDDLTAFQLTVSENLEREDLKPWEQAKALLRHRTFLEAQGESTTVRAVAQSIQANWSTLAPYLRVAEAISPRVLALAGGQGRPIDDRALCELSLAALERAARGDTDEQRAEILAREIQRVSPTAEPASGAKRGSAKARAGLQINIRTPLDTLPPERAIAVLDRILPAARTLAGRASKADRERFDGLICALDRLLD